MEWWAWLVLGLVLAGVEIFTPGGFYLLFFGLAAMLVGGLTAAGVSGPLGAQVAVFVALSIAGVLIFRRALVARFGRHPLASEVDSLAGTPALALENLDPGAMGKVELRGASWTARNSGGVAITRGQRCTVERVDGLTLWVRVAAEEFLAASHSERSV
jgi:inner membrane protein